MRLSNQAMGALMMALQKSLLEQCDIVPVLKDFLFVLDKNEELIVENPPVFKIDEDLYPVNIENKQTTGSD